MEHILQQARSWLQTLAAPSFLCYTWLQRGTDNFPGWMESGSNGWARAKRERTKSRERRLRTILFWSGHLQHERDRPDMERTYINSDKAQTKEPHLKTYWSGAVGGGVKQTNKASSRSPM